MIQLLETKVYEGKEIVAVHNVGGPSPTLPRVHWV
jgi:hypothetical protein